MFKIFEHLESPDIFKVSEVCKYWLDIAQHPKFVNKTIVKLHSLENNRFLKSWRKFNFKLNLNMHLPDSYFEFKEKFSDYIIEIEFDDIFLRCLDTLRQYLENLNNLKSLKLNDCRIYNLKTVPDVSISLNVKSVFFSGSFLSAIVVDYILSITPNLEVLTAIFERHSSNSKIVRYLKNVELTKSLRELNVFEGKPFIFNDIFQSKHLNLQKFIWDSSFSTSFEESQCLQTFLKRQTNLKVLEINANTIVKLMLLSQVISICSLNQLEHLSFNCYLARDMKSLNFEPIWNLKYLKLISADSNIFKGLSKISKMECLKLIELDGDINDAKITDTFQFLINLKVFHLVLGDIHLNYPYYIKNQLFQAINKHLIHLRELFLEDGSKLVSVPVKCTISLKISKIIPNFVFTAKKSRYN